MSDSLRDLREAAKLTQDELCLKSGVSQGVISQIERGDKSNPTLDTMQKLAEALGTDIATIASAVRASEEVAEARR